MQQNAGPAGPQQHIHFTSRCSICFQGNKRLAQGFFSCGFPRGFCQQFLHNSSTAKTIAARALDFSIIRRDTDIEPVQWPHVVEHLTIRPDDCDVLIISADRRRDLTDF